MTACLIDVYETILTLDFDAHASELRELAGLSPEEWDAAWRVHGPALNDGRLSVAAAYRTVLSAAGRAPGPDLLDVLVQRDLEILHASARLHEDAVPFLEMLRSRGIRTAFVSNCADNTRPLLDALGVSAMVDELVLSCEIGSAKPAPDIYRTAVERLDVPAGAALFVDDQPAFCAGAEALGIRAVLIDRGSSPPAPDGTPVVSSLMDIEPML